MREPGSKKHSGELIEQFPEVLEFSDEPLDLFTCHWLATIGIALYAVHVVAASTAANDSGPILLPRGWAVAV